MNPSRILTHNSQKNKLTKKSRIHLVMREDKQKYAMTSDGKPNLLIDDYIKKSKYPDINK